MSLSIAFITARLEPEFDWFFSSLAIQGSLDGIHIIIVDYFAQACDEWTNDDVLSRKLLVMSIHDRHAAATPLTHVAPKPDVWAGPHRLTKETWWHAATARNTAACVCKTDFIAFVDDRSVLQPGWLKAVRRAMKVPYAICGSYEKRTGITVEGGHIRHSGIVTGSDGREAHGGNGGRVCPGEWMYGCTFAMPLEWYLAVNGQNELTNGLSFEDVLFGKTVDNSGYPIKYDSSMKIIEDRTPGKTDPSWPRTSKEKHPHDPECKGHKALNRFAGEKRASHQTNLREVRDAVQNGKEFPIPTEPTTDWYDGTPLAEQTKFIP